jgi:hypothetical protein
MKQFWIASPIVIVMLVGIFLYKGYSYKAEFYKEKINISDSINIRTKVETITKNVKVVKENDDFYVQLNHTELGWVYTEEQTNGYSFGKTTLFATKYKTLQEAAEAGSELVLFILNKN